MAAAAEGILYTLLFLRDFIANPNAVYYNIRDYT